MSFSILGTGSSLPGVVVTNDDLAKIVDTSDEWITARTGIRKRRVLGSRTLLELAEEAARQALGRAGLPAEQLDYILCTTVRGDYATPSLAGLVGGAIGANCPAMDLNAACAGFLYALDTADALFQRGRARRILIVSAEAMSRLTDWTDRATCVLFGDGAGAAVVSAGGSGELLAMRLRSQPNREILWAGAPRGGCPFGPQPEEPSPYLHMNGQEVYKFAVRTVTEDAEQLLEETGLTAGQVDWFLLHQANRRILDAARGRLGQPEEKFPMILEETGNMSSACIPVLLDTMAQRGCLKEGQVLFLSAFGAGLVSGSCLLRL